MKNKLFYLLGGLLFVFASCSVDRMDLPPKANLPEPIVPLTFINLQNFDESEQCPSGGLLFQFGVDTDGDGVVSEDEIQSSEICNGIPGQDGVDGTDGTDGTNGTDGTDGQDGANGSDGVDGTDGTNGVDGLNGYNSLVRLEVLSSCEECEFGGFVFYYGLDTGGEANYLDDNEILGQQIVCFPEPVQCNECFESSFEYICHKVQIGNDWKFVTLYVPESAVDSHIGHGDSLGECED